MIEVTVGSVSGTLDLTAEQTDALEAGGLDPETVWYEYVTQHDNRVRPLHAALDGSVWKVGDPFAPVPPIDYGCRCYLRYVGKPGSVAARILPEAPAAPTTKAAVYAEHLDEAVPTWREVAKAASSLPLSERAGAIYMKLKALGIDDARDVTLMIVEASKA